MRLTVLIYFNKYLQKILNMFGTKKHRDDFLTIMYLTSILRVCFDPIMHFLKLKNIRLNSVTTLLDILTR